MASTSGPKDPGLPRPGTWAGDEPGSPPPGDPPAAGQQDPLAAPAAYTAAPNTWPTGSKPTLRMAANSPEVSEDPHVPLTRISAIRASATAGNSALTTPSLGLTPRDAGDQFCGVIGLFAGRAVVITFRAGRPSPPLSA